MYNVTKDSLQNYVSMYFTHDFRQNPLGIGNILFLDLFVTGILWQESLPEHVNTVNSSLLEVISGNHSLLNLHENETN